MRAQVNHDIKLTVTFNRDQDALATFFPTGNVTALAFADEDLVIGSDTDLRRVGLDGTVRWSVLAVKPTAVVVARTGDVYSAESAVVARHSDGSPKWQNGNGTATAVAAAPNGDVVVINSIGVSQLAANDGSPVWSASLLQAVSVAVDSTGMTAVGTLDGKVHRFDASGAPLTPDWSLPWVLPSSLAFGAQDFLVVQLVDPQRPDWGSMGFCAPGGPTLARLDRMGNVLFRVDEDCIDGLPSGLLPNGLDLFSFGPTNYQTDPHIQPYFHQGGLALRTYGLDGSQGTWSLSKQIVSNYCGPSYTDVATATTAACDGHGRCAVGGTFALGDSTAPTEPQRWPVVTSPWVEVLAVP